MFLTWIKVCECSGGGGSAFQFLLCSLLIYMLSQELESVNSFLRANSSSGPHTQGFVIVGVLQSTEPPAVFISGEKNIKGVILKKIHSRKMQHSTAFATDPAPAKDKSSTITFGPCLYKGSLTSKSFKWCEERLKWVWVLPASLFQGKMLLWFRYQEGRKCSSNSAQLGLDANWKLGIIYLL